MKAEPLNKTIYNEAKELGVEKIILQFSGGSDEGLLDITLEGENVMDYPCSSRRIAQISDFEQKIEDWAWEVYDYSGAGEGEGVAYGDNITYDLKNNEVHADEWFHAPQHIKGKPTKLKVAKN